MPFFYLERGAGMTALGGLEIPHVQQQFHIILLAPHQDGTKQGHKCSHSTLVFDDFWASFRGFNQRDAEQDFSVWPFRSRDFSVVVVSASRYFGQTMKSCRILVCSLFNANLLEATKVLFKKKTTNMIQDPTVYQHQHITFIFISKQI